MRVTRALISVSDKAGVVELAKGLQKLGIEIISTGGTAKVLKENGVKVKDVSEVTGFPEMLGGRVKTLHPKIHGGILAVREKNKHMQELKERGIQPIDLVVVNLYPFEETINRTDEIDEVIENIDIGGPAMLRSAAKNYRNVAVVVDPADYTEILEELRKNDRELSDETRKKLAAKAFARTARYDTIISNYLGEKFGTGEFPGTLGLTYEKLLELRYGENPHQKAALYKNRNEGIAGGRQLHGRQLSFNNMLDLDAALKTVNEFEEPTAVIIKHGNPCGVASEKNILEAYRRAHACDPVSAYGGVVAVNRQLDEATAKEIVSTFIEALAAPSYDAEALEVLGGKKNLRVMELAGKVKNELELR
ncbi:MAG TPA: bifunctional phosphoribosylaminoimidazolecarboxamide formyltransferase/IMP cyclohydrolase, partial [Hadesarchaea archaeon]|nr:bifunctional phosphoribosylaminoimidazolecarboxamide formyltransferase/IMP cyclohydrolase [Hadesarchaea archaeon]